MEGETNDVFMMQGQDQAIIYKLGQIESSIKSIQTMLANDRTDKKTLEDDIKSLKDSRSYMWGALGALGFFAVFIKDFFTKWLNLA